METLEDLKRQLRKEVAFEENKKEIAALGKQRQEIKSQIRSKKFARERPKTARFFGGLVKAAVATGRGVQKAAAETQRRDSANKKNRSSGKKKFRTNLYGERMN